MMAARKPKVQSLDRGLRLLEFIANQDHSARLNDLADLLGIEKSSACRLVVTLMERGYVRKDSRTNGYVLHEKVFELAGKLAVHRQLKEHASKYLERLARQTDETAHLAVLGSGRVVFIDHCFGSQPLGVTSQSGCVEPLHCTALGKALMAGWSVSQLRQIFGPGPLRRYTSKTITRLAELAQVCQTVRRDCLAFDHEERHAGIRCVAAPVFDFSGRIVAALGISGPTERLPDVVLKKHGRRAQSCALALSQEMGYQNAEPPKKQGVHP
ncbi:MAG: IclR family transcriptional regulator [Kiritimatiellae bacterium]|nr:IclR family transcriptional regulator [Kiritimatiellia bacterium]